MSGTAPAHGKCLGWFDNSDYHPGRECKLCWNKRNPDTYRGELPAAPERPGVSSYVLQPDYRARPLMVRRPCIHLGPVIEVCMYNDRRKDTHWCIFEGHDVDRCTTGAKKAQIQCCMDCRHYEAPAIDKWTRHLIYHLYPISGNGAWQRNVKMLCDRLPLFNGKKIVTIAMDPETGRKPDPTGHRPPDRARFYSRCGSVEAVQAAFGEFAAGIEFIVTENDPTLREVKTLVPMLERLPDGPEDVTLYAQAKGTTRHSGHPAHHWSQAQYVVYLDYWPVVAEQLRTYPVTGAFKKLGPGWSAQQSKSDWHYSGSWFWFRNADLFARDWRTIDQFWSGIEPYPSQHFYANESGCLFHEASVPQMNLYRTNYWQRIVDPALQQWRKANEQMATVF